MGRHPWGCLCGGFCNALANVGVGGWLADVSSTGQAPREAASWESDKAVHERTGGLYASEQTAEIKGNRLP